MSKVNFSDATVLLMAVACILFILIMGYTVVKRSQMREQQYNVSNCEYYASKEKRDACVSKILE